MSDYQAPVRDINFVLKHIVDIESLAELPGFEEATPDLVQAIVDEAARLSNEIVAPTNQPSDQQGARIVDGGVVPADGLGAVYQQLIEGGWISLPFSPDWGGQGLPAVLALAEVLGEAADVLRTRAVMVVGGDGVRRLFERCEAVGLLRHEREDALDSLRLHLRRDVEDLQALCRKRRFLV